MMGDETDIQQDDEQQELFEVTVLVDGHQHEGKPVAKGKKIQVTEDVLEWMIDNKIGA